MAFFEKKLESDVKYAGRIITVKNDTVQLDNGTVAYREVVEHLGGVGIVAVDADGFAYMVRQYRYPLSCEVLEIPAGKLERDEDPYECAVRELAEETGFSAGKVEPLINLYPSPGYCQERLYIYLATQLTAGEMRLDPDEFLSVEKYPLDSLCQMVYDGKIPDAKTAIGLLVARERLSGQS